VILYIFIDKWKMVQCKINSVLSTRCRQIVEYLLLLLYVHKQLQLAYTFTRSVVRVFVLD